MSKILRAAVVGTGFMGRNHCRILHHLANVELVAVVDTEIALARSAAHDYSGQPLAGIDDLPDGIDFACVATPAVSHAAVARQLLERGIHCLVEKPFCVTEDEGEALIALAARQGLKLSVGHIERFNPTVPTLLDILAGFGRIRAVEAKRLGYVAERNQDVDVVLDLMIHDIDIIQCVDRIDRESLNSQGFKTATASKAGHVVTTGRLAGGAVLTLTASRIVPDKVRQLTIVADSGMIVLDYVRQELLVMRSGHEIGNSEEGHYRFDMRMERVFVRNAEPLQMELLSFINAVANDAEVGVTARQALDSLKVVWSIQSSMR